MRLLAGARAKALIEFARESKERVIVIHDLEWNEVMDGTVSLGIDIAGGSSERVAALARSRERLSAARN